jgi:hypothetical protein
LFVEVYGFNALLVTMVVWLLVKLLEHPAVKIQKRLIYAVALTLGLAVSHHFDSAILFAPLSSSTVAVSFTAPAGESKHGQSASLNLGSQLCLSARETVRIRL